MKLKKRSLLISGSFVTVLLPLLFFLQQKLSVWPVRYNRNAFYQAFLVREKLHAATIEAMQEPSAWKKTAQFWIDRKDAPSAVAWIRFGTERHGDPQAMVLLGKLYLKRDPAQAKYLFALALKADPGRLSAADRAFCLRVLENAK